MASARCRAVRPSSGLCASAPSVGRFYNEYIKGTGQDGPFDCRTRTVVAAIQKLSQREKEVLDHLISGKQNKAIAKRLGISVKTIKVHRAHVMEKMGVCSMAQLVRMTEKVSLQPAT
jgi:DNA-binding NarL/FixJ family response regulator